jgi:diaminohydroxyphosphoribosylaminopyrimidine deaminase/5-amino-6-(5-phosphoribosylamino)uracil reductase
MAVADGREADARFMAAAVALARRGLGRVWPNPSVGCVIVKAGRVVGRGSTQPGGRPHGETEALGRAGAEARGATAYVSLEPCDHLGQTPPCTRALLEAGIARVVIGCIDPDPRVSGRGVERLRQAGVDVVVGVGEGEARAVNEGFLRRVEEKRPMVTLKLATSLDGRVATRAGESRWITGETARARGHGLRARHDAILIGIGTALADDPELTCRLPGLGDRSPVRIVADGQLRLPLTGRLAAMAGTIPTWVITGVGVEAARAAALIERGVAVIAVPRDEDGRPDLAAALAALAERGVTRVLAEGGPQLAAALLRKKLVDRLEWFRAPRLIGGDGLPALGPLGVERLEQATGLVLVGVARAGEDLVESYRRRP